MIFFCSQNGGGGGGWGADLMLGYRFFKSIWQKSDVQSLITESR